ncbi:MAG: hypothetical protein ACEQSH_00250 [Bacteroidia bacterium]
MSDPAAPSPIGSWRYRRRIIHWVLLYCGFWIPVGTWWGYDKPAVIQVVLMGAGVCTTIILAYIGVATADDHSARKAQQQ